MATTQGRGPTERGALTDLLDQVPDRLQARMRLYDDGYWRRPGHTFVVLHRGTTRMSTEAYGPRPAVAGSPGWTGPATRTVYPPRSERSDRHRAAHRAARGRTRRDRTRTVRRRCCSPTSAPTSCASTGRGGRGLAAGPHERTARPRQALGRAGPQGPVGAAAVLDLVERADVLVEGFRPGVAERLGVGPDDCLARNPRLVYGRMTGWGQDGPLRAPAGHDITYIAVTGALARSAGRRRPTPRSTCVGDFGGGGCCLVDRRARRAARRRARPGGARSSTPPWWTAPPTSPRCSTGCSRPVPGRTGRGPTCSTAGRRSTGVPDQ